MSENEEPQSESDSQSGTEISSTEEKPKLSIQVGVENGKVIVLFSQRLTTFTLPPDDAEKMGLAMIHHAKEAQALAEPE